MQTKKGLVHIYTGTGKGKTTSAVGLAVRALSHDRRVCYVFFNKKPSKYGYTEIDSLKKLGANVLGQDIEHPRFNKTVSLEIIKSETLKTLDMLHKLVHTEPYDLLIMDEILISVRDQFIEESVLQEFILDKPKQLELVLTGRGATENIIALADYVSEINKIKHPMDRGIGSREGVEY